MSPRRPRPRGTAAVAPLALAALVASGCAPRTEIFIEVDTDLSIPDQTDRIELRVTGPSGSTTTLPAALANRDPLPLTLYVEPRRDPTALVSLSASALRGTDPVSAAAVAVAFTPHARRVVRMMLRRQCGTVLESPPDGDALVGSSAVETGANVVAAGTARAYSYRAVASGTVRRLHVYLDRNTAASTVDVGLYADDGAGNPAQRLTHGAAGTQTLNDWTTLDVPPVEVRAGEMYWLAVLAPAGGARALVRTRQPSGCASQTDARSDARELPVAWMPGAREAFAPTSMFASE